MLRGESQGKLDLPNRDCDTGRETRAGEYVLADKTYARLIDELTAKNNAGSLDPAIRGNLLQFYADPSAPVTTRKNGKAWRQLQNELDTLRSTAPQPRQELPAQ
jgi:hypothetical protein